MSDRDVETLAAFVHGALAALHGFGAVFHLRRGDRWHAAFHAGVATYDAWSALRHLRRLP